MDDRERGRRAPQSGRRLKVNDRAQVIGTDWNPIAGLYTCGEMVGGLFHHNYPGGWGLMSGAVVGRIAGANAAGDRG